MLSYSEYSSCHGTIIDEDRNEISGCYLFLKIGPDFIFQKSHFYKVEINFKRKHKV